MRRGLLELEGKRPALTFYALCLLIAWPFVTLHALNVAGRLGGLNEGVTLALLVGLAQFSPSLAAFILVGNRHGAKGVRRFLRRAVQLLEHRAWLAVAVLLPLFIVALTVIAVLLSDLPKPDFEAISPTMVPPYYLISLALGLVFGGLSEEFGWRGYLLPVLQREHSALVSGLVVGVLWAFWHLDPETMLAPLFTEGFGGFVNALISGYGSRLLGDVATAVLMIWLFNSTRGSLLVAILFHASVNAAQTAAVAMWSEFPFAGELINQGISWALVLLLVLKFGAATLSTKGTKQTAGRPLDVTSPVGAEG